MNIQMITSLDSLPTDTHKLVLNYFNQLKSDKKISQCGVTQVQLELLNEYIMKHITNYKFSTYVYHTNRHCEFNKINSINVVLTKRQGVCYELNYIFSLFLQSQGYHVECIDMLQYDSNGNNYSMMHMALRVNINGKYYYVDVGNGAYFRSPIEWNSNHANDYIYMVNNTIYVNKKPLMKYKKSICSNKINSYLVKAHEALHNTKPEEHIICAHLFESIYDANIGKYIKKVK